MLKPGKKNMKANIQELMGKVESSARNKAILTIAKSRGISYEEAQMAQARRIAQAMAHKKL